LNNQAVQLTTGSQEDKSEAFALFKESFSFLRRVALSPSEFSPPKYIHSPYNESEVKNVKYSIFLPFSAEPHVEQHDLEFVAIVVIYNFSLFLQKAGETKSALELLHLIREEIEQTEYLSQCLHPTFQMSVLWNLATMLHAQNCAELSWPLFVSAIEIGHGSFCHQELLAFSCTHLADLLMAAGHTDPAFALYRRAADIIDVYLAIAVMDTEEKQGISAAPAA